MESSSKNNKIQTVLGLVSPSTIHFTLPHEHILIDAEPLYVSPPEGRETGASKGFELNNLGWIRYFPYSHKDNLQLNSEELALKEMIIFKQNVKEGATIVDVTTEGIRSTNGRTQDVLSLQRISKESGVHIICGSGYYIAKAHPKEVNQLSIHELAERIVKDIEVGIDGTEIKAGVIGEIGCSWPITEDEKKVLRAAVEAQKRTGAPLIIHPGRNSEAPIQILQILEEAGANLQKTVMSHLDRTVPLDDIDRLKKIAAKGVFLEFDLFGVECSYYQQNESVDMVSDAQRILAVKQLVNNGLTSQILLAHDIHTKHRLVEFGGHGYSHIPINIVPRLLKRGIALEDVNSITVENPRRWLTFFK